MMNSKLDEYKTRSIQNIRKVFKWQEHEKRTFCKSKTENMGLAFVFIKIEKC